MAKKILLTSLVPLTILICVILPFSGQGEEGLEIIRAAGAPVHGYAIYTEDGDVLFTGSIDSVKRRLFGRIIVETDGIKIINPVGIVENPPPASITDIKKSVLKSLDEDKKVLLIYIDGLGYDAYERAAASGKLPFVSSLGKASEALTVYPSITDVTFASMVTGTTPRYTGIHNREKKPLQVETIFDAASGMGKSSLVIEADAKILTDEVNTILNIDDNKNGTIDDEIYEYAMKEIHDPPHILLVHFHSYDDMGHRFGPDSGHAAGQLKVLDSYIENIVKNFPGDVIITSDHGMHSDGGGGSHGAFSACDMLIPIIYLHR